ncbi:MAG: response regulator transcription factor [Acidobacteria bacterium]|nr:response regulator transcription factor [Acidobacteriota bacterium]
MNTARIRILIVDDHAIVREGLCSYLRHESDMEVVAQCGSADEAIAILSRGGVDFTFLDLDLGSSRATGFIPIAREAGYRGPVVILTGCTEEGPLTRLLAEGAAGIHFKSASIHSLPTCVREVMAGMSWLPPQFVSGVIQNLAEATREQKKRLSARERDVLLCILEGKLTKEIAAQLRVSETSVKGTLQQLFEKTGVRKRSQLVRYAFEHYRDEIGSPGTGRPIP